MANIIETFPKGGAGGGHTILDTTGAAVAQESKMQFVGASVTDDSTNGITKVAGEGLNQDSIDDIVGASTLVPAVIIGDANNYSTTEKIIGKWIDGKPLYQKTVQSTTPNTIKSWQNLYTEANSTIINVYSVYVTINNIEHYIPYSDGMTLGKSGENVKCYMASDSFINKPFIMTIQYTKTTD